MSGCRISLHVAEQSPPLALHARDGGSGGTATDYEILRNHPRINGVELIGDKTGEELGLLDEIENTEILAIWNTVMAD